MTVGTRSIRDLVASATIFASTVADLLEERLHDVAGDRLTFAQWKVLTLVDRTEAKGVSEIATFLGISPAAASKTVGRLVRAGLLSREAVLDDRRTKELRITWRGKQILDDFDEAAQAALTDISGTLTPDDVTTMTRYLDRLSLNVMDRVSEVRKGLCFRCSIHFRDQCMLRDRADGRTCYLHIGQGGAPAPPLVGSGR
jgi:DNA-binding MarR family transcriptional regulator